MQDNQQDHSFLSTSFGQTLSNSSLRNDPMTRDNITQAEEMALNQIASDDQILRMVNDGAGTTSNATPNGRSMSLGDVLEQRISDLEALQNAAETASKEGREGPSWTESNQYDLDFYKSILYENPDARPEDRITYPRFSHLKISDRDGRFGSLAKGVYCLHQNGNIPVSGGQHPVCHLCGHRPGSDLLAGGWPHGHHRFRCSGAESCFRVSEQCHERIQRG